MTQIYVERMVVFIMCLIALKVVMVALEGEALTLNCTGNAQNYQIE